MSPRLLALIPVAVAINVALGRAAEATVLPLFLDAVGTILVAALAGPAAAVGAGVTSQVTNTVLSGNATWLAFTPVQVVIGLYAGLVARRGGFRRPWIAVLAGAGLGVCAAAISTPISYFVFQGVTAGGVTAVTTLLRGLAVPLPIAVAVASAVSDVLDKSASFALVFAVLHALPHRTAARFPLALRAMGRGDAAHPAT